jgi:glyoxylase-like metal-dependent hydrolase (beta-lactamase superfamily II)/rhodanese-related sulfurtransferase
VTAPAVQRATIVPILHPQGCRSYLIADPLTRRAAAVDVHLDRVAEAAARLAQEGWDLKWVVDTHTHADHPSGAKRLADWFSATRVAHERAGHAGVTLHPKDGEEVALGGTSLRFLHAPGHTPDHLVVATDGALFSGDSILIGAVARTDFLGGDAGTLWDSIRRVTAALPPETTLYPGHDYRGRVSSSLAEEMATNPWLRIADRGEFVARLTAKRPPRPANMDELLRWNREGLEFPSRIYAADAIARVQAGNATSVIDVRTDAELAEARVAGSRHIPVDQVTARADEVRATPAPRLILCRTGRRAQQALQALDALGVQGLSVIEGGIEAWRAAGGKVERSGPRLSVERQRSVLVGGLSLLGAALALVVSPWFALLPAFLGAGLLFAGLSGWCGMDMLLRRLPWNRAKAPPPPPATGACAAGACSADAP